MFQGCLHPVRDKGSSVAGAPVGERWREGWYRAGELVQVACKVLVMVGD